MIIKKWDPHLFGYILLITEHNLLYLTNYFGPALTRGLPIFNYIFKF